MDEDEEVDRQGGDGKMSDHLFSFVLRNTHLKAVSYIPNCCIAFATSKRHSIGVSSFAGLLIPDTRVPSSINVSFYAVAIIAGQKPLSYLSLPFALASICSSPLC